MSCHQRDSRKLFRIFFWNLNYGLLRAGLTFILQLLLRYRILQKYSECLIWTIIIAATFYASSNSAVEKIFLGDRRVSIDMTWPLIQFATLLHILSCFSLLLGWRTVHALIRLGADINIKDVNRRNVLHLVVMNGGRLEQFAAEVSQVIFETFAFLARRLDFPLLSTRSGGRFCLAILIYGSVAQVDTWVMWVDNRESCLLFCTSS